MIKWLKSLFSKKKSEPEEVVVRFRLPNGKEIDVTAIKTPEYLEQEKKCKTHWEYNGVGTPTNNCNTCWEYHASKMKH